MAGRFYNDAAGRSIHTAYHGNWLPTDRYLTLYSLYLFHKISKRGRFPFPSHTLSIVSEHASHLESIFDVARSATGQLMTERA